MCRIFQAVCWTTVCYLRSTLDGFSSHILIFYSILISTSKINHSWATNAFNFDANKNHFLVSKKLLFKIIEKLITIVNTANNMLKRFFSSANQLFTSTITSSLEENLRPLKLIFDLGSQVRCSTNSNSKSRNLFIAMFELGAGVVSCKNKTPLEAIFFHSLTVFFNNAYVQSIRMSFHRNPLALET